MVTDYRTYQEWIDNGNNVSDVTDEVTADALTEYFFAYRLGWKDEKTFERYYKRNLSIYYPMYKEQLRLQPGGDKLLATDWFVQNYEERQNKHTGTNSGSSSGSTTSNGSKTSNTSHTVILDKTTYDLNDHDAEAVDLDTRTGGHSDTTSGGHSDTISGGHNETHIEGDHTTEVSPHVKKVRTNGGHVSDWSGHSEISAQLPMSESYSKFIGEGDDVPEVEESGGGYQRAYQHMPALNWNNASAQGQSGERKYTVDKSSVTESYEYNDSKQGDITKTHGDKSSPDTTKTEYDNEKHTVTYDDEKHTFKYDENGEIDKRDIGARTHTKTGTVDHTVSNSDTGSESSDGSTTTEGTTAGKEESTDREIHTGRSMTPAEVIAQAIPVIQRTNAFLWFVRQLEPCFLTDMEE